MPAPVKGKTAAPYEYNGETYSIIINWTSVFTLVHRASINKGRRSQSGPITVKLAKDAASVKKG
jgi:hypothetical protein